MKMRSASLSFVGEPCFPRVTVRVQASMDVKSGTSVRLAVRVYPSRRLLSELKALAFDLYSIAREADSVRQLHISEPRLRGFCSLSLKCPRALNSAQNRVTVVHPRCHGNYGADQCKEGCNPPKDLFRGEFLGAG